MMLSDFFMCYAISDAHRQGVKRPFNSSSDQSLAMESNVTHELCDVGSSVVFHITLKPKTQRTPASRERHASYA